MLGKYNFTKGVRIAPSAHGQSTVSPYRWCSFRCVYCNQEAQGRSQPWFSFEELDTAAFREEVRRFRSTRLMLGNFADIYPPAEEELGLSRRLLEVLVEEGVPFRITTISDLVVRDIDLIKEGAEKICVSAPFADAAQVRRLEPYAPSFERRVAAVHQLADAGVDVAVGGGPWIPGVSETEKVVAAFAHRIDVKFGALSFGGPTLEVRKRNAAELKELGIYSLEPRPKRALGRHTTQEEVNAAYLAEAARWIGTPRVHWAYPPGHKFDRFMMMTAEKISELCTAYGIEHRAPAQRAPNA